MKERERGGGGIEGGMGKRVKDKVRMRGRIP